MFLQTSLPRWKSSNHNCKIGDAEISFLRQEVTRCTNDVLVASQTSNKRNSDEIHELLTWFDTNIARVVVHNAYLRDTNNDHDL
ncbi:hypothetical protein CerSpe_049380 [Prunus speciosa]